MDRRQFTKTLLAGITTFALMDSLLSLDALGSPVKPIVRHWAILLNEYCADLRRNAITPVEWQALSTLLLDQIPLPELLKFIDFHKLQRGFQYPDLGVHTQRIQFPKLEGLPERTVYGKKLFGMQKGRAVIPHGHSNMVSAHLILQGEMHLRHYEKIDHEAQHLIIRPTIDRVAKPGESSSISDEKDNVHWFIAQTDAAFTFDIIVSDLNDNPYDIHNLDMDAKQSLSNGLLRVPIMDVEMALQKYGKETHH